MTALTHYFIDVYKRQHQNSEGLPKEIREINCLNVLYPKMFRKIEERDLIAGRYDALPLSLIHI